jgi:hypothetical protein
MGQRDGISSSNGAMVRLDVLEQQSCEIWGELSNMTCEKPIPCMDMGDFLLKLDALYEKLNGPIADMQARSFYEHRKPILQDGPPTAEPAAYFDSNRFNLYEQLRQKKQNDEVPILYPKSHGKPSEVFFINTIFRRHASWQGEVLWERARRKICFRSALELLHLIRSALQEGGPRHSDVNIIQFLNGCRREY